MFGSTQDTVVEKSMIQNAKADTLSDVRLISSVVAFWSVSPVDRNTAVWALQPRGRYGTKQQEKADPLCFWFTSAQNSHGWPLWWSSSSTCSHTGTL